MCMISVRGTHFLSLKTILKTIPITTAISTMAVSNACMTKMKVFTLLMNTRGVPSGGGVPSGVIINNNWHSMQ